jgi:hypothetical protein
MFVEMCVVWQESQQCLPCRSTKQGSIKNGEGRCRVRSSQMSNRFCRAASDWSTTTGISARQHINHIKLLHILHTSSHSPVIPHHSLHPRSAAMLNKRVGDSPQLAHSNFVSESSRGRGPWTSPHALLSFRGVRCFTAIQAEDDQWSTNISDVLPCRTHLPELLCVNTRIGTSIGRKMQC